MFPMSLKKKKAETNHGSKPDKLWHDSHSLDSWPGPLTELGQITQVAEMANKVPSDLETTENED